MPPPASSPRSSICGRTSWGPRLEHFLFHGVAALISRRARDPDRSAAGLHRRQFPRSTASQRRAIPKRCAFGDEEYPELHENVSLGSHRADPEQGRAVHRLAATAPDPRPSRSAPRSRIHDEQPAHLDREPRQGRDRGAGVKFAWARCSSRTCNLSRWSAASLPPQQRVPFFVHVDEFQTFSSDAFASLLSEARKFATHFALANQYTDQLPHAVRSAVIGNAGSLVVFRVGSRDAELLAPEFRPMEGRRARGPRAVHRVASPRHRSRSYLCGAEAVRAAAARPSSFASRAGRCPPPRILQIPSPSSLVYLHPSFRPLPSIHPLHFSSTNLFSPAVLHLPFGLTIYTDHSRVFLSHVLKSPRIKKAIHVGICVKDKPASR